LANRVLLTEATKKLLPDNISGEPIVSVRGRNLLLEPQNERDFAILVEAKNWKNLPPGNTPKVWVPDRNSVEHIVVIKGVEVEISMTEIEKKLTELNFQVAAGGVRRLLRGEHGTETLSVKVPLKDASSAEKWVSNGLILLSQRYRVVPYKRPFSPIQCWKCQHYGHFQSSCGELSAVCMKCGGGHHHRTCEVMKKNHRCCLCGGNHRANDWSCKHHKEATKTQLAQKR
jgi:hypothetical protein